MSGKDVVADGRHGFHETPLIVFSFAAIAGTGAAFAGLLAQFDGVLSFQVGHRAAAMVLGLVGGGLCVSMFHLGRRERAFSALRRPGRSVLGAEIAFAALTCCAALVLLTLPLSTRAAQILWATAAVAAIGLLISLIRVYILPAQLAWSGISSVSPMTLSLLFAGATFLSIGEPSSPAVAWSIGMLILTDAAVWFARCLHLGRVRVSGTAAHPRLMAARFWIVSLRFGLVSLVFPVALLFLRNDASLAVLTLGVLSDRFAFYGLAVADTTESQIRRVEVIVRSIRPV